MKVCPKHRNFQAWANLKYNSFLSHNFTNYNKFQLSTKSLLCTGTGSKAAYEDASGPKLGDKLNADPREPGSAH
jgi:hypothetical protein